VAPSAALWSTASFGHSGVTPSQASAGSQVAPEEARHSVPAGTTTSSGQAAEKPVHSSA
jgi:hypothetical protein